MGNRIEKRRLATGPHSPVWKAWRGLLFVSARVLLARARGLFVSHGGRSALHTALALVGLLVQVVLLLVVGYMIDLCISLMELWAELAQKHLEITL